MAWRRAILGLTACAMCFVGATGASAGSAPVFHPRVANGLGLMPAFNRPVIFPPNERAAAKKPILATYHGGQTMSGGITVHTIFWTGGTHPFKKRPAGAPHDYIGMIEQYFSDIAAASTGHAGATCTNSFCDTLTVQR